MPATDVRFRAAFADETARAAYLDPNKAWPFGDCRWFLALVEGPPERIVGCIRFTTKRPADGGVSETDFRLLPGPGGELTDGGLLFLTAFLEISPGNLHYADPIPEGDVREHLLRNAGFSILHRERFFETPWEPTVRRVAGAARALKRRNNPALSLAEVIPARELPVEAALPLLLSSGLMTESEIRSIWNSPDPARIDRDASACLVLDGETLGVVICAHGGSQLHIKAIVGREDIPGARQRSIPLLMDHAFRVRAGHGYQQAIFRANVETAAQTVNLALRLGGRVTGEVRRWFRPSNGF